MDNRALAGKKCLVTGASRGLGYEIARCLKESGAEVLISARDSQKLRIAADALGVFPIAADLERTDEVERLAVDVASFCGNVDVLINSAGVFPVARLSESCWTDFERCMAINVRAPFQLAKIFSPGMVERKWGRIVNIGSSSAYAGFRNTSIYCASKHALLGLSRSLNDELRVSNVRVCCISPGSIKTDMGRKVLNQDFDTFLDATEVAEYVVRTVSLDGSMIVDEVRLNRMVIR